MQVTLKDSFSLEAPRQIVWSLLSDPFSIVECVPGAKITDQTGEHSYRGAVTMKVGPVTTGFVGDIEVTTMDAESGTLVLIGRGQGAKGRGRASMDLNGTLTDEGDCQSRVDFTMVLSISGKLAQIGSRLVGDVGKRVLAKFVKCFRLRVQEAVESAATQG